jgi:hypothetical protein
MHPYGDDCTVIDKLSCDQIELACPCGHRAAPCWGLWCAAMKQTPLRRIQPRMVCQQCGKRRPTIAILSYTGGRMRTVWQWPPP